MTSTHTAPGPAAGAPAPTRRVTCSLRGMVFFGCGVLATLSGVIFGQRELLEVGLLLLLVPVVGLALLAWRPVALSVQRPTHPQRCFVEHTQQLSVQITPAAHTARLASRGLVVEETLPFSLGTSPSFRIDPHTSQSLTYSVRPSRRGFYAVGPLHTTLSDPLGLWELAWRFPGSTPVLVAPRLVQLPELALYGRFPVGMRTSASVWNTEDDLSVREYRHGDSQRRIHWRASARKGELMVRREEQPEQGNATVLLDDSEQAHRASGVSPSRRDGPVRLPSFEQAVSVAASLTVALTTAGFGVNLRTRSGQSVGDVRVDQAAPLLDVLSEIELTSSSGANLLQHLPGFGAAHSSSDASGVVIAVLGHVDGALLHELSTWPTRGRRALAILMSQALNDQHSSTVEPQTITTSLCQEQLSTAGWKVLTISHLDELADLWMGVKPSNANYTSTTAMGVAS